MQQLFLTVLLVVATVLGVGMVMPQIFRLQRTGSTEGVSIAWIGVGVAMNVWWTVYSVSVGLWGLLPVAVIGVFLYTTMTMQVVRLRGLGALRWFGQGVILLGALPLPFLVVGGIEAAGVAVGLCYAVQFSPAVIESFRSSDLQGLSPLTWLMALAEALIWLIFGVAVADLALIIGGAGGSVASAMIVAQLVRVRKPRIVFLA